jgi:hypothetical protein
MGPAATALAIFSFVSQIVNDVAKAEKEAQDDQAKLEVTRQLEGYRYGPHQKAQREAFVAAIAPKLPRRLAFMAHPLRSARTQWQIDFTISTIEVEMWR